MKYPLATSIITLAVFGFMALLIGTGELTFTEEKAPSHLLDIHNVVTHCPDDVSKDVPSMPVNETFTAWLDKQCNQQPACSFDTRTYYNEIGDDQPQCTAEIIITSSCDATTEEQSNADPHKTFLYEGQHAKLACTQHPES